MATNPIAINAGGKFRFIDFMNYIPDFLKEEKDVVTLMQIFSDYLNNAYRNIEDSTKFTFSFLTTESMMKTCKSGVDDLVNKLSACSDNDLYVYYLSMPRTNVNSNSIEKLSYATASIYYDGSMKDILPINIVTDTLSTSISDGDVLYIKFNDGNTYPYYVNMTDGTIVIEQKRYSQDPFKSTLNVMIDGSPRIVKFIPKDVGETISSYVGQLGEVDIYEIKFDLTINTVENAASHYVKTIGNESVEIDLFGYTSGNHGAYSDYVKIPYMNDKSIFEWRDGNPTGVFYFSDLYEFENGTDSSIYKEYHIDKMYVTGDGYTCYLTLSSAPSFAVNDTFRIDSSEIIGTSASADVTLYGEYTVRNIIGNVVITSLSSKLENSPVTRKMTSYNRLYKYSINYARSEYDVTSITPMLKWSRLDSIGTPSILSGDRLYTYDAIENKQIGYLTFSDIFQYETGTSGSDIIYKNVVSKYIHIPSAMKLDTFSPVYMEYCPYISTLSAEEKAWITANAGYLNQPVSGYDSSADKMLFRLLMDNSNVGFKISGATITKAVADKIRLKVYSINGAFGTAYTATADNTDAVIFSKSIPESGDICLLSRIVLDTEASAYSTKTKISKIYNVVTVEQMDSASGKYHVYFSDSIPEDPTNTLSSFISVSFLKRSEDAAMAVADGTITDLYLYCKYVYGDIYSHDYWMSDSGQFALKCAYTDELGNVSDIVKFSLGNQYSAGDLVYRDDKKKVYKVMLEITGTETLMEITEKGLMYPYMYNVAKIGTKTVYNDYMKGIYKAGSLTYGKSPDLSEYSDYSNAMSTFFSAKAEDNSLIFGWKDREYLLNHANYNTEGKARNGFAEFYTTGEEYDIVLKNLEYYSIATTIPDEGVLLKGLTNEISETSSSYITAARQTDGSYIVSVRIDSHGFPDNSRIRVSGAGTSDYFVFDTPDNEFDVITVVDKNNFTFARESDCLDDMVQGNTGFQVTYYRSIYNPVTTAAYYFSADSTHSANYLYITTKYPHGYSTYSKVTLINMPTTAENAGWISNSINTDHNINKIVNDYTYAIYLDPSNVPVRMSSGVLKYTTGTTTKNNQLYDSYSVEYPEDGDVIKIGDTYYKVSSGEWVQLSGDTIETPFIIYTHQNLFDVTSTNPQSAVGDSNEIESIIFDGIDEVTVIVRNTMDLYAGKSCVYVHDVYPMAYNGRFVVNSVLTPRMFTYKVSPGKITETKGRTINNGKMKCEEGKWFRYEVSEVELSRKSVYDIYKYGKKTVNHITDIATDNYIATESAHGLNAGDGIVIYKDGAYVNAVVDTVISKNSFSYLGAPDGDYSGGYVFKGIYIAASTHADDVNPSGLYSQYIASLDRTYTFSEGDIVFANDNLADDMPKTYIAREGIWTPCTEKRIMKIHKIDIDKYHNAAWDTADTLVDIDEYIYRPYSYPEVVAQMGVDLDEGESSYVMPFHIRNYNFAGPYIEHLDSTVLPEYQFNSKKDYASVAQRSDFSDTDFKGIPDMKYPLVEKLERLIYLRDAQVIDYDLIGYLARFMGYDITDAKNEIDASIMYRTPEDKEKAVRETVSNLPQFYTLGGTQSGLEMLLETFGVVADVIVKWTNTESPYGELINEDDVRARQDADYENGKYGNWVPTPHVAVKISATENYKNGMIDDASYVTLIKNIKAFKPIQAVFDEFIKYVEADRGKIYVSNASFITSGRMSINMNCEIDPEDESGICG